MSKAQVAEEKIQALLDTLSDVIKQQRIDRLEVLIWDVVSDYGNEKWQDGYQAGHEAGCYETQAWNDR